MTRTLKGLSGIARAVLAFTLGLFAAGCSDESPSSPPPPRRLVVLSPHPPAVVQAMGPAFSAWHLEKYQAPVTVQWITKGTNECHRYLLDTLAQGAATVSEADAVDIFFGGSIAIHADLARRNLTQPIPLPEATLAAIPGELHGQPLYAADKRWIGTALTGIGLFFNRAAAEARGVPAPAAWADLAAPAYANWIAAADLARSGSTNQFFVLILLKQGWQEGWGTVMGVLANTSGLLPSSAMIAANVEAGVALVGPEPDFLGRMRVAESPDTLVFIIPAGGDGLAPDAVSVPVGARSPELATRFVEFVLSAEAQALCALPPGDGGPDGDPLYRYPIRPDVYEKHGDKLMVKGNPFKEAAAVTADLKLQEAYTLLLPRLVGAACRRGNHLLLQRAWRKALAEGPASPAWAALKAPPFDDAAALKHAADCRESEQKAAQLEAEWSAAFQSRFRAVLDGPSSQPATP